MKKRMIIPTMIVAIALVAAIGMAIDPNEGYIDGGIGPNYTRVDGTPDTVVMVGGNISQMNVTMEQQTQFWGGFYGNVSYYPVLEGNTDNFYTWSGELTFTLGWVLFANSSTITWSNVVGTQAAVLYREQEDLALGLTTEVESVNNTFTSTNAAFINVTGASAEVAAGEAWAVNTNSNGGSQWETALLRETGTNNKIYAGVVDEGNQNYAGDASDYQVMLPVSSGTGIRTYYLFVGLQ